MNHAFRGRLGIVLCASLVGLGVAACGERTQALDQTHIGGERFTRITYEGLPSLRDATRLEYKRTGRQHVEKLELAGATPGQVVAFFDETLRDAGWAPKDDLVETREGTLATWERMGRSVAVLAAEDPEAEAGTPVTIYTVTYLGIDRPGG